MAGEDKCTHASKVKGNANLGTDNKKDCKDKDRKSPQQDKKPEKDYGSWGSTYKKQRTFF